MVSQERQVDADGKCRHEVHKEPQIQTVVHFVGVAPGREFATHANADLVRMQDYVELDVPKDTAQLRASTKILFDEAIKRIMDTNLDRLVILVDAINQLDNEDDMANLRWLPDTLHSTFAWS